MEPTKTKLIKITIDGKIVEIGEDKTILEAAEATGINIPALCRHPDLTVRANCRMCMVEVKGERSLVPACATKVKEGMEVLTANERIHRTRKTNLTLIMSQHHEECEDCVWYNNCSLLKLSKEYGIDVEKFSDRKADFPIYEFGPIVFDQTKCIDCRNCVEMCEKQQANYLELKNKGFEIQVAPSADGKKDCIYCGQCIVHCPAGAIESAGEFEDIERPLKESGKVIVAQFAPSIRASIGEVFSLPHGSVVTGQLVTGLKKLGFSKVFDVATAADFTTIEEAEELVERIKSGKGLPMFTSCCPAWVKYVEFYRPDLIPNLTSVKSPQNMLGSLIKTFWAQKEGIDEKNITVVSIMPCTAKKYEIEKPEARINGLAPIDCVLTTRELGRLMISRKIDLAGLEQQEADDPLGFYSGAGVIYGVTGGVMESAIRTAYWKLAGKNLDKLDCQDVRGIVGLKTAEVKIGDLTLKAAVANGMANAKLVLEILEKNPRAFDYVEVMACPGGCIGGGGQPMPVSDEIRKKGPRRFTRLTAKKRFALPTKIPKY